jgi:hypothetical protein
LRQEQRLFPTLDKFDFDLKPARRFGLGGGFVKLRAGIELAATVGFSGADWQSPRSFLDSSHQ